MYNRCSFGFFGGSFFLSFLFVGQVNSNCVDLFQVIGGQLSCRFLLPVTVSLGGFAASFMFHHLSVTLSPNRVSASDGRTISPLNRLTKILIGSDSILLSVHRLLSSQKKMSIGTSHVISALFSWVSGSLRQIGSHRTSIGTCCNETKGPLRPDEY